MVRKTRSDSTRGQLAAASAPDLSARTAPTDAVGFEQLNSYGRNVYNQLYKSRADWTSGDLALIAQCGIVAQTIDTLHRAISPPEAIVVTNSRTGAVKIHPSIAAIAGQRSTLMNLLRDAGLRQRDNNKGNFAPNPQSHIPSPASDAPAPQSFEDWMEEQMSEGKPN